MPNPRSALILVVVSLVVGTAQAQDPLPIFDAHLHAGSVFGWGVEPPIAICNPFSEWKAWNPDSLGYEMFFSQVYLKGKACDDPLWSPITDEDLRRETIRLMEQHNIYGVVSGSLGNVQTWVDAAPDRFIPGLDFSLALDSDITPDSLRDLVKSGQIKVFGEVTNAYDGIHPNDPKMHPYWAVAEELGVPVGYHLSPGRPGEPHAGYGARASLSSALTLEEVLLRYPGLRLYIMHAGYPFIEDLIAILHGHPQVYVDVSDIATTEPRKAFYRYLQQIVEAGFSKRILFGSDQMAWPQIITNSIASIDNASFLTAEQKRDILYNNAARFFRLTDDERAMHHGSNLE